MKFWQSMCGAYFCMFIVNKLNMPTSKIVGPESKSDTETQEV